jgi:beta-lactamase class C
MKIAVRAGLVAVLASIAVFGVSLLLGRSDARPTALASPRLAVPAVAAEPAWQGSLDYAALDERLQAMMGDPSMTGLAVAVVEDGRIAFVRGYGVTAEAGGEPIDAATSFRWASVSKTVAGVLSAQLAAEGAFSLSERLSAFPTSLQLPGGAERHLTVEQLLSQQTGLPKNAYDGRLEGGEDPVEIRTSLASVATVCPPGACHTYQNIAFDAVSEVIAARTGKAYEQVATERLFAPLGMTSATLGTTGLTQARRWAQPHRHGQRLPFGEAYYRVPAAAGVNSNIVDLAKWMQALMGLRPDVLSPDVVSAAQRPRVATGRPYGRMAMAREITDAGYGLGIRSFAYRGHLLVGHSGGLSGYRATLLFDPERRTGIAMLWNSDAGLPFRFQGEFFDHVYDLPFTDFLDLEEGEASSVALSGSPRG